MDRQFGIVKRETYEERNLSREAAVAWVRASERGVAAAGVADYLPRVAAPTLLIYGPKGGYKKFQAVGEAKLRSVRVEIVPGSGAFTHQDNPEGTAVTLSAFFAS